MIDDGVENRNGGGKFLPHFERLTRQLDRPQRPSPHADQQPIGDDEPQSGRFLRVARKLHLDVDQDTHDFIAGDVEPH